MTRPPRNIVASVQARLVQRSHELHVEHQLTLARFAGERLLYRLYASPHADRFIVKGAALLLVWFGDAIRPTKDVDLLGFGDVSADALRHIFADVYRGRVVRRGGAARTVATGSRGHPRSGVDDAGRTPLAA